MNLFLKKGFRWSCYLPTQDINKDVEIVAGQDKSEMYRISQSCIL